MFALCAFCMPNLEFAALEILAALKQGHHVLAAALQEIETGVFSTEFGMLVQLDFFAPAGLGYRMTVPESITLKGVQQASLNVASTAEDDGDGLEIVQPERLLDTLPKAEAEAWRCTRLALSRAGFRIPRPAFVHHGVTNASGDALSAGGAPLGSFRERGYLRERPRSR